MKRWRNLWGHKPDSGDQKYETAIRLADEVTAKMRERSNLPNPFRGAISEMLFGAPPDIGFLVDVYEAGQESRIFRGPPNGHG